MECAPIRAQAWLDRHEDELLDLRVEDAVALVEGAGLAPRVLPHPGDRLPQEQRRDRVNLWLTATGAIGMVDAG